MEKNRKNVQAKLSPEKYITTKARSLEIYKCWLNTSWKDSGMAQIVVARQHPQGTFTLGIYLVDTWCRGVFDSFYRFSIDSIELEDLIDHSTEAYDGNFQETDYNTVHNIIYGAEEYAFELGIRPCKEWGISQYILEEDNDDIPLIEIEFGRDGKPLLCVKSYLEASRYIPALNKSVGEGNYGMIVGGEDIEQDYDDDDEYYDEDDDCPISISERMLSDYPIDELSEEKQTLIIAFMSLMVSVFEFPTKEMEALKDLGETTPQYDSENTQNYRDLFVDAFRSVDEMAAKAAQDMDDENNKNILSSYMEFSFAYENVYDHVSAMSDKKVVQTLKSQKKYNKFVDEVMDAIGKKYVKILSQLESLLNEEE